MAPAADMMTMEELEVDFDKNVTKLYESISGADWEVAIKAVAENPSEARTWVVRHDEEDGEQRIMWRFLPIHSACARHPPESIIASLLRAYPEGAAAQDDQGMYPLHYACGNQASGDVIRLLLLSYPTAASVPDPHGMLPIHYLAQWGPSGSGNVEMLLFSYPEVADARDIDGNTPLDLAREGDYPERDEVIKALTRMSKPSRKSSKAPVPQPGQMEKESAPESSLLVKGTPSADESETEPESVAEEEEPVAQETPAPEDDEEEEAEEEEEEEEEEPEAEPEPEPVAEPVTTRAVVEPPPASPTKTTLVASRAISVNDDDTMTPTAARTITKLKAEITKLQAERAFAEAELEERMENEREVMSEKLVDMEARLERLNSENEELKREKGLKEEFVRYVEEKLAEKETELTEAKEENIKLTTDLETTNKERNEFQSRSTKLAQHLKALSGSLVTMLEKQERIIDASTQKDERMRNASVSRQKRLQELMEAENRLTKDSKGEDIVAADGSSETVHIALEAQKQQIETAAGVIGQASKLATAPME